MEENMMVGGILDSLLNLFKPDWKKIDKAKMKSGVGMIVESVKPAIPGTLDDTLLDLALQAAEKLIDQIGVQGPLVVGAVEGGYVESEREFSASDIDAFTAAAGVSEDRREYMRKRPRIMKVLHAKDKNGNDVFTDEDRVRVAVGFPWLMIIQLLGPLIINLILKWLGK